MGLPNEEGPNKNLRLRPFKKGTPVVNMLGCEYKPSKMALMPQPPQSMNSMGPNMLPSLEIWRRKCDLTCPFRAFLDPKYPNIQIRLVAERLNIGYLKSSHGLSVVSKAIGSSIPNFTDFGRWHSNHQSRLVVKDIALLAWNQTFRVHTLFFSGWWLTYPSEKWWSSWVGMMTFPTIYGNWMGKS